MIEDPQMDANFNNENGEGEVILQDEVYFYLNNKKI